MSIASSDIVACHERRSRALRDPLLSCARSTSTRMAIQSQTSLAARAQAEEVRRCAARAHRTFVARASALARPRWTPEADAVFRLACTEAAATRAMPLDR